MNMINNEKEFKEKVLAKTGIQAVTFFAEWSGPSQVMAPIFTELKNYYSSSIAFYTVDVETAPGLKEAFGVNELPTMLIYQNGALKDVVHGMTSRNALIATLENAINQP